MQILRSDLVNKRPFFLSLNALVLYFQIDWDSYLCNYILGARHFLLKEKPETLPKARILLRRLYLLDKLVSVLLYGLLLWLIYSYWNNIIYSVETVFDQSAGFINHRFTKIFKEWTNERENEKKNNIQRKILRFFLSHK